MYTRSSSSGDLSSGSPTTRRVWPCSRPASTSACELGERCCATTIGCRTSSERPARSRLRASRPPHEAPITMSSYTSPGEAIDPFVRVDRVVAFGERREEDRLLASEREDAERLEALCEQAMDAVLKRLVEVD